MENDFERCNAVVSLLSQSYNDGIQKIVENKLDTLLDFQMPQHILEKRTASWNKLFKKYSSMICEDAFNALQIEETADTENEPVEPRMPMRKPMSMVQYWVDTGNQPYMANLNKTTRSDSGSSLAEEGILELEEVPNSLCVNKQSEVIDISRSKFLTLASSSNSSVDTAAYILANNNTTKKAETLAIVEGSKVVNQKQNHSLQLPMLLNTANSTDKNVEAIGIDREKYDSEKILEKENSLEKNHFDDNIINKNNEPSLDQTKIVSETSMQEQTDVDPSVFINESDESVINRTYTTRVQRKKLYKNTDSPAEFTPQSEAASSHKAPRLSIIQCEHPAFQTPKLSKPSYLVKLRRRKYRKRTNRRLLSMMSLKSDKTENKQNVTSISRKNIDNQEKSQHNIDKHFNGEYNRDNNSDSATVQEFLDKSENNNVKKSFNHRDRYNLKPVHLVLHKLPYTYEKTKADSIKVTVSRNEFHHQLEKKCLSDDINNSSIKQQNITYPDNSVLDDKLQKSIKHKRICSQSSFKQIMPENKKHNYSTIRNFVDYLKFKPNTEEININDLDTQNNFSIKKAYKDKNKILSDKSIKFVVVVSSSDESETIVVDSNKKFRKRSLKRKIYNDEISDEITEHTSKESLNLNKRKKNSTKLKSTESPKIISQEIETEEKTEIVINKDVSSEKKSIDNINKKSEISLSTKKNNQLFDNNTSSNEKVLKSVRKELESKNDQLLIKTNLTSSVLDSSSSEKKTKKLNCSSDTNNKSILKLNNVPDSRNSLSIRKKENGKIQSLELFNEECICPSEYNKLTSIERRKIENKKMTPGKDSNDPNESNLNKKSTRKSKRNKTEKNNLSTKNTSKRKSNSFLILSDDECFIPLKIKT